MWVESTETDFGDGLVSSVTIAGTGAAAYVRISTAQATGGTITYSGGYTIHTFTSNGTFTPNSAMNVEVLVVGGGGGGGSDVGAGGGGARVRYVGNILVTGNQNVVVGNGGNGGYGNEPVGTSFGITGQSSSFGSYSALGGCGGGGRGATQGARTDGWSGGGGGYNSPNSAGNGGGAGGAGNASSNGGGGGGSAPAAGASGNGIPGTGGAGLLETSGMFSDNTSYYGGGGGGSGYAGAAGSGGIGGGGAGTASSSDGNPGIPNTGGGGGGGGTSATNWGGTGGSGIVIVRYSSSSYHPTGTYKSNVLDSGAKVIVSSIGWTPSSQPGGTSVIVGVRASSASFTAGSSWPDWVSVINGGAPAITGRYVQYMSTYTTTVSTVTPRIEEVTVYYAKAKPWQEKSVVRTGANSYGIYGAENFEWEIPAKSGQLITVTAYIRYNANYGAASKPKITLYNLGVNSNATMSASADTWEQLQVSGTPNRNGVLKLKTEGFSTSPGAKMYVDDIQISQ
ncbi:MAG: glycine-rich domain-containing protein [Elusimicrobiota bacterium]